MTQESSPDDLKRLMERNKKQFDELFDLIKDLPTLTNEQLQERYQEVSGQPAPQTTRLWLITAISYKIQAKYYEDRGLEVPEKAMKQCKRFFAEPIPEKSEEKERKMGKKAEGAKAPRKEKSCELLLKWKSGKALEEATAKQKQEHIKLMLQLINAAGDKGIAAAELGKQVAHKLSDKKSWEKCSLNTHVSWVLKKFADYVVSEKIA
jgi:hypothetical protein